MKILKIFTGTVAVAVALATTNQAACQINTPPPVQSPLRLTISGIVKCQDVEDTDNGSVATHSFTEKTVYLLVSNYVANARYYSYTNIAGTNLPANGYIAFNSNRSLFYVTNKAGFYYPLSGFDDKGEYFSWIELDSLVFYGDDEGYLNYGIAFQPAVRLFNTVASYHLDSKGNGSSTCASTAVFYIHDDPYNYDDADNPFVYWENDNPWQGGAFGGLDDELGHNNSMIEIRGVLTTRLYFKAIERNLEIKSANLSLSGTGNFYEHDIYNLNGVLTSGNASLGQ